MREQGDAAAQAVERAAREIVEELTTALCTRRVGASGYSSGVVALLGPESESRVRVRSPSSICLEGYHEMQTLRKASVEGSKSFPDCCPVARQGQSDNDAESGSPQVTPRSRCSVSEERHCPHLTQQCPSRLARKSQNCTKSTGAGPGQSLKSQTRPVGLPSLWTQVLQGSKS